MGGMMGLGAALLIGLALALGLALLRELRCILRAQAPAHAALKLLNVEAAANAPTPLAQGPIPKVIWAYLGRVKRPRLTAADRGGQPYPMTGPSQSSGFRFPFA